MKSLLEKGTLCVSVSVFVHLQLIYATIFRLVSKQEAPVQFPREPTLSYKPYVEHDGFSINNK